ncbi:MAG: response regulator [Alphaproteobacteria bacterium]|nr:response regulator [Alphaproteobacteria bacterium]
MLKCIVGDDSKVVRVVIAKMLHSLGFEVLEAEDGESVVELFLKAPDDIDLIVMDYHLPALEGLDALRKIRNQEKMIQPNIILMTSNFDIYKLQDSLGSKADDFIIKPFDEDILRSKLEILNLI